MTRRPHWAGELLVVLGLLVVYDQVAGLAKVRVDAAVQHGRELLALSPFGLEKAADHWLAGVSWLHAPAAYYYDLAHIDVTMAVLVACFAWRSGVYRRARTALVAVNLVGLTVFLLFPVAPPRLLPGSGFVDIVAGSGTWGAWEAGGGVADHANEFGSMPSLHIAWAVWVALTVTAMTSRRSLRALGWVHVLLTAVVVVVTGNHYVVDIAAGAATTALAWAVAPRLAVRRQAAPVMALAD
ncbi:MAG: phosphatase PAP2 family protein [Mycobacteriales bacterium]